MFSPHAHTKRELCHMIEVLAKAMMVIILKNMSTLNQYIVHLKQCYMLTVPQ